MGALHSQMSLAFGHSCCSLLSATALDRRHAGRVWLGRFRAGAIEVEHVIAARWTGDDRRLLLMLASTSMAIRTAGRTGQPGRTGMDFSTRPSTAEPVFLLMTLGRLRLPVSTSTA